MIKNILNFKIKGCELSSLSFLQKNIYIDHFTKNTAPFVIGFHIPIHTIYIIYIYICINIYIYIYIYTYIITY